MALNIENKKAIVAEVAAVAADAVSAIAADYRGLTVAEMTELRGNARKLDIYLKVVRNTLACRALEETSFSCLRESLTGPIVLAFGKNEPGAPARLFRDFIKTNEKLSVKAIAVNGKMVDAKQLDQVASLPSRDEAISILMATMKAPITKFVRTLAEPHAKLVRTIAAIRDKKQAES